MLSLFRTNQAYAGLLLFVYALVLWLPVFFIPDTGMENAADEGILGKWVVEALAGSRILSVLATVILVGIQGIQLNTWAARHHVSRSVTQFPGLFLVLVSALVFSFHGFSSFQVANVFLLFFLLSLGRLYKREEPAVALFNAGAWLGVASLFRPEYLLFLPAGVAAISILRRLELRSLLQLLTGVGMVYFFTVVAGYVFAAPPGTLARHFSGLGFPELMQAGTKDLLGLGLLGLLILAMVLSFGRVNTMLNIEGSKNVSVLAWLLLCSMLVVAVAAQVSVVNAQVVVVPLGGLLGLRLVTLPNARAEAIHVVLVAAALIPLILG